MPFVAATRPALVAVLALALAGAGCVYVHDHAVGGSGPPPWAPAHGYRHHHHGVSLVFDAGLGVYAVVGRPGIYFHHDHYLRLHAGGWEQAVRVGGPWLVIAAEKVPAGLHRSVAERHGRGKGKHRHKH